MQIKIKYLYGEEIHMKVIKKLFIMLILSVFMISMVAATVQAVSVPKEDKQIEAKYKVAKVKVTWNANGGKIGTKKIMSTSVKKGAKLSKLATAKRSGYTFKGWYTKKIGGKKISKNTKVTKGVTFYGQWKKKSAANIDSKLLGGTWEWVDVRYVYGMYGSLVDSYIVNTQYVFKSDGKFSFFRITSDSYNLTGNYKVSNGKITFTNIVESRNGLKVGTYPNTVAEYKFTKSSSGNEILQIGTLTDRSKTYLAVKDNLGTAFRLK